MPDPQELGNDWLEDGLASTSPSERLRAAAHAKANPGVIHTRVLMRAIQRETVPQIRQLLNDVLLARDALHHADRSNTGRDSPDVSDHVPELARLIRHELSPPIGWIRKAANLEISEFSRSRTGDAVNRLDRRIDALVSLIREGSALDLAPYDLEQTLRDCWPDMTGVPSAFSPSSELGGGRTEITTDLGLLEILLANIYQNAIDAAIECDDDRPVEVSWSAVGDRFWIRVSNPFAGSQFNIEDVETKGISTKSGHQGIGMALIKTAADRLGYGFRVAGRAGVATFSLSGARY